MSCTSWPRAMSARASVLSCRQLPQIMPAAPAVRYAILSGASAVGGKVFSGAGDCMMSDCALVVRFCLAKWSVVVQCRCDHVRAVASSCRRMRRFCAPVRHLVFVTAGESQTRRMTR